MPTRHVGPIHFEDFGGQQFERLVFAYHFSAESWRILEWYGQCGQRLGRDIWGVRNNGETVCIQCANRRTLPVAKVIDDLNKVASKSVPTIFRVVSTGAISATKRDAIKVHAESLGIAICEIWSGPEFEEHLRQKADGLLKRFMEGVVFPDDPPALRHFVEVGEMDAMRPSIIGRVGRFSDESVASKSAPMQVVKVAHTINRGIIANHVTMQRKVGKGPILVAGSIGTDPAKYNYVEYLIKRLASFREIGSRYGQQRSGKVHVGVVRNILEQELGGLTKDLSLDRFEEIVSVIKVKIDNTIQGRRNRAGDVPNYHSFTEHPGSRSSGRA